MFIYKFRYKFIMLLGIHKMKFRITISYGNSRCKYNYDYNEGFEEPSKDEWY